MNPAEFTPEERAIVSYALGRVARTQADQAVVRRAVAKLERSYELAFPGGDGWHLVELRTGEDVGGWRHFLAGQPLSCGASLILRSRGYCPDGEPDEDGEYVWIDQGRRVRYEVADIRGERRPVLYIEVDGYDYRCLLVDWMQLRWPER